MMQRVLIAIGAGLAAAILFVVPVKGTAMAMFVAILSALPIMIAGLGFGQASALIAGGIGAVLISLFLTPIFGGAFLASVALPSWWLARQASLCRTGDDGKVVWYPISLLLGWIVALSIAMTLAIIGLAIMQAGGYQDFTESSVRRIAPALEGVLSNNILPGNFTREDFARLIVGLMPAVMAGWAVVSLALNLWLAGRVVLISQLLTRTWEDLPEHLALPLQARHFFIIGLLGCLIDGPIRMVGSTIAAAIGVAYAFQGLAAVHFISRGSSARTPILMGVYFTVLVMLPWPLIFATITGLIETVYPLRRPKTPPRNPPLTPIN